MKYLFKVIPIPKRWWVKTLIGLGWFGEASLETQLWYTYAPKYLIEIINPASIAIFISTYFAVIVGALHLGLSIVQLREMYRKKFQSYQGDLE